jgi:hypothetical protein
MSLVFYTTNQAPGAIPNNTLIVKCNSEPEDFHRDGALGRVLGSIGPYTVPGFPDKYGYWVEWADHMGHPVFIRAIKIRKAEKV